jgi:hypothetical protein
MDTLREIYKALVLRQSLGVPVVDLLNNYGNFETREREIKDHVARVSSGGDCIAFDQLAASECAR